MRRILGGLAPAALALAAMTVAALTTGAFAQSSPDQAPTSTVQLRGAATLVPTARLVAEDYMSTHAGAVVTVEGGGTARGVKALIDGTADIALATHRMDAAEIKERLGRADVALRWNPIGFGAVVPIVHVSNPVTTLTRAQLRAIYVGDIVDWKVLGGPDRPIRALTHDATSGAGETWARLVIGPNTPLTRKAEALDSAALAKAVAEDPAAIGFYDILHGPDPRLSAMIKALAVDGITADVDDLRSRRYPLLNEFFLVVPAKPSAAALALVAFFTDPTKGQVLLAAHGIIGLR